MREKEKGGERIPILSICFPDDLPICVRHFASMGQNKTFHYASPQVGFCHFNL